MGDDPFYWVLGVFDIDRDDEVVDEVGGVVVVVHAVDVHDVGVEVVLEVSTSGIGLRNNINGPPV